VGLFLREKLK